MGVVVDGIALDHRGELLGRLLEARRTKVGAPQGLTDGALVGLQLPGPLERHGRGHEIALLQQVAALPEQFVCALGAHCLPPKLPGATEVTLSASTASRIAPATARLEFSGTRVSPALVTMVTSLSDASKPMSKREMSLTTT